MCLAKSVKYSSQMRGHVLMKCTITIFLLRALGTQCSKQISMNLCGLWVYITARFSIQILSKKKTQIDEFVLIV